VLPKQDAHPNMRFVGRKIRKYFSMLDATKSEMWESMEGVVKSYSPMRVLFKVTYVDDDWEELDFEELQMILIMGVPYGDSEHDSGKTRPELNDLMTFEALLTEIQDDQIQNKIKMTDDCTYPCTSVQKMTTFVSCTTTSLVILERYRNTRRVQIYYMQVLWK
jgi:hypothetical protein